MAYRPPMRRMTVAEAVGPVVTLEAMRQQCRIAPGETEHDDDLRAAEAAAVLEAERLTNLLLIRRAVTLLLPGLPPNRGAVELPGGPVGEITSVTVDGAAVAGAQAYGATPALLIPSADWPVVTGEGYPVAIVYTAGFATVPAPLISAVRLLAEDLFDRPASASGAEKSDLRLRAEALLDLYRVRPA